MLPHVNDMILFYCVKFVETSSSASPSSSFDVATEFLKLNIEQNTLTVGNSFKYFR